MPESGSYLAPLCGFLHSEEIFLQCYRYWIHDLKPAEAAAKPFEV